MIDIRTGEEMSRRDFGKGIAAILAAGCAPSVMGGMMRNTGGAMTARFWEKKPYDEELVWLRSNGNQYIDTLKTCSNGSSEFECGLYFDNTSLSNQCLNGCDGLLVGTNKGVIFMTSIRPSSNKLYLVRCVYPLGNREMYVDGVLSGNGSSYHWNGPMILFGWSSVSTSYQQNVIMQSSRLIVKDTLEYDMIAVLKNGVPCMYDRVSKGFFYNQIQGHQFGYLRKNGEEVQPY